MRTLRQWAKAQREERARRIEEGVEVIKAHHADRVRWDEHDRAEMLREAELCDEPDPEQYVAERFTPLAGDLDAEIRQFRRDFPRGIREAPRTWTWWLRWGLVLVCCYVGTAFMAHALRHPEMTETQRFLDFWNALLWR